MFALKVQDIKAIHLYNNIRFYVKERKHNSFIWAMNRLWKNLISSGVFSFLFNSLVFFLYFLVREEANIRVTWNGIIMFRFRNLKNRVPNNFPESNSMIFPWPMRHFSMIDVQNAFFIFRYSMNPVKKPKHEPACHITTYCDVPGSPCLSEKGPVYGPSFFFNFG